MLAGMKEPVSGAVSLQPIQFPLDHDLDRPDTADRCRQQQRRQALRILVAAAGSGGRIRLAMSAVTSHSVPTWRGIRWTVGWPTSLKYCAVPDRIQRAEIRNDRRALGLLQRDNVSGRIQPEFGEVCALVVARIETSRRLRDVHELQRHIEMRCDSAGTGDSIARNSRCRPWCGGSPFGPRRS